MGIFSTLVLLPVKGPIDFTIWIARQIEEAANEQRNDQQSVLSSQLRAITEQWERGEVSQEEYETVADSLISELLLKSNDYQV